MINFNNKNNNNIATINFFDILEDKKSIFSNFLINKIKVTFNKFNNIINTKNIKYTFLFNDFYFKINDNYIFSDFSLSNLNLSLYIPIIRYNKKSKKNLVTTLFLANFPLFNNFGYFYINGTEKAILQQLIFDPILFFEKYFDANKNYNIIAKIFNESELHLQIKYNTLLNSKYSNFSFLTKDNIEYPLSLLLLIFGLNKNILNIIIKDTTEINKIFNNIDEKITKSQAFILLNILFKNNNNDNIENMIDLFDLYNQNFSITKKMRYKLNKKLNINIPLNIKFLTKFDFIKIVEKLILISNYKTTEDDIDSLLNKSVVDLDIFLDKILEFNLENIKEQINLTKLKTNKKKIIKNLKYNNKISHQIDEFFSTSDISIVSECTNPLAEIAQKRKILNLIKQEGKNNIPIDVRDIHDSIHGRICVIETPEGQSSGLISNLTTLSLTNIFGFIETPFLNILNNNILINTKFTYLTVEEELLFKISFLNLKVSSKFFIFNKKINSKYKENFYLKEKNFNNKKYLSYLQFFSLSCSTIPFFEHNDGNRVLMGANMQRQAVPLLFPQKPIVSTFLEELIAQSVYSIKSLTDGFVTFVNNEKIIITNNLNQKLIYFLDTLKETPLETVINHNSNVWIGEQIYKGQILTNGFSIEKEELSLGSNLTIAYLSWEGFNFEDSVIISDKLVLNNQLTSLHIKTISIELNSNEILDYFLPNIKNFEERNLSNFGLIKKGSYVLINDILVIKKKLIQNYDLSEEGIAFKNNESNFTYIKSDFKGRVLDIRIQSPFNIKKNNESEENNIIKIQNTIINIYILQIKKIKTGDKISGRFGNKGIISKILPKKDMPYLLDGTPIDIILNPLGIPSRMNLGQLYEGLLGFSGSILKKHFKLLSFDESFGKKASKILISQKLKEIYIKKNFKFLYNQYSPGKNLLIDGRTGEIFDNPILVSSSYILKLFHLVDEKITSRAEGPNSLLTQQPVKGKNLKGGQRMGEMEVWAIEAYGASNTIQDLLVTKSDDIFFNSNLSNIISSDNIFYSSNYSKAALIFNYDLRALGLDLNIISLNINDSQEINLNLPEKIKNIDLNISSKVLLESIFK